MSKRAVEEVVRALLLLLLVYAPLEALLSTRVDIAGGDRVKQHVRAGRDNRIPRIRRIFILKEAFNNDRNAMLFDVLDVFEFDV